MSRSTGEAYIQSVTTGFVLDAGHETQDGHRPQLQRRDGSAWQRWKLAPTPDGLAYVLRSADSDRVLDCPPDAGWKTQPIMYHGRGRSNQEWVVSLPIGSGGAKFKA